MEEEERLAKEHAEHEKEEREWEAAERRRQEEEKEKAVARAKEKGKGRAQPQDESTAGSSWAASEGSSRKQAQEDKEDKDEEVAMVVKKLRKKRGPTIMIRPQLAMDSDRVCQQCHDLGLECVVASPKGDATTRSCGPCYEHKKKCQPLRKELNQPLIDINESAMKALIGTVDNLVAITDQMSFRLEKTLDLMDEYMLWKMGQSAGSSSGKMPEDDEEGEAEKGGDEMEED